MCRREEKTKPQRFVLDKKKHFMFSNPQTVNGIQIDDKMNEITKIQHKQNGEIDMQNGINDLKYVKHTRKEIVCFGCIYVCVCTTSID